MRIVACITQAAVIRQILTHLRTRAAAGARLGARSPPWTSSSVARGARRQPPDRHIVAKLGEVLAGQAEERRSPDEITLFESLGLAVEDVAAPHFASERALETVAGQRINLVGKRA